MKGSPLKSAIFFIILISIFLWITNCTTPADDDNDKTGAGSSSSSVSSVSSAGESSADSSSSSSESISSSTQSPSSDSSASDSSQDSSSMSLSSSSESFSSSIQSSSSFSSISSESSTASSLSSSSSASGGSNWPESFEQTVWPSSGTSVEESVTAVTGTWKIFAAYRTTSYHQTGTASLSMATDSYFITPLVDNGIKEISFYSRSTGSARGLIYYITENGTDFTQIGTGSSGTSSGFINSTVSINNANAKAVKIVVASGGTAIFDDVSLVSMAGSSSSGESSSSSLSQSSASSSYSYSSYSATGEIFISPAGNDSDPGSASQPLYSLSQAISAAVPGNVIYVRGGTYSYNSMISLAQSGTASDMITIAAYPGEHPVFDFSNQPYGSENRALLITGNYWHLKCLEICNAGDNGIKLEGNNNIIENCVFHHNGDSGIQLGFGHNFEDSHPGISQNDGSYCANNLIINCDSYLNFDFDSKGGDADGFSCKMHNGMGNKFTGCRSWHNSDDGWDLYETDYAVEILNCWTWHNGDQADFDAIYLAEMGTPMSSFSGNGNGFKLGGDGTGGQSKGTHIVKNCVAFDCNYKSKKGFDQNSHKGGVIAYNCTSFGNGYNYMFELDPTGGAPQEFRNCISFDHRGAMEYEFSSGTVQDHNSWNLSVTANSSDFLSIAESLAEASRESDGSLPNNNFARLAAGSDLINAGVNVGLPYNGLAPDLGAFEY